MTFFSSVQAKSNKDSEAPAPQDQGQQPQRPEGKQMAGWLGCFWPQGPGQHTVGPSAVSPALDAHSPSAEQDPESPIGLTSSLCLVPCLVGFRPPGPTRQVGTPSPSFWAAASASGIPQASTSALAAESFHLGLHRPLLTRGQQRPRRSLTATAGYIRAVAGSGEGSPGRAELFPREGCTGTGLSHGMAQGQGANVKSSRVQKSVA